MTHVRIALSVFYAGATLLLVLVALFAGIPLTAGLFDKNIGIAHGLAGLLILLALFLCSKLRPWLRAGEWLRRFETVSAPLERWMDEASPAQTHSNIAIIAGLSLFLELVLIRWQGSLFPVYALYKNFTLLACFCGLGIGYALARRTPLLLPLALPALAASLVLLTVLRYASNGYFLRMLYVVPVQEASVFTANTEARSFTAAIRSSAFVFPLLGVTFLLNVSTMLPLGQFCGALMERDKPLVSYGYNLLGSIAGVVLLFALSALWAGPALWFGAVALLLLWYLLPSPAALKPGFVATALCIGAISWPSNPLVENIYSPYQLIQKGTKDNGLLTILASGSYFQEVRNLALSNANRTTDPALKRAINYYEAPYRLAASVKNVAIVGAGSGNDVAAALRAGAGEVDAVEIDPAVRDLGRMSHPEHPYDNPRVHSIINDARSFFRSTSGQYDVIVYSWLDSHILLSHGSNVRVDSFVYTTQGFQEAFDHLKPGGLMCVSFSLDARIWGPKIYRMLKTLKGAGEPVALSGDLSFLVRKGADVILPEDFLAQTGRKDITAGFASSTLKLDLPTDDWPFFYMDVRMYPASYVFSLALMLLISFFLVRSFLSGRRWQPSLLPFFFLGSGFMLVETKAITELGLLFGNTWQVIGITIIGVLVMAFLANLLAARVAFPTITFAYVLLLAVIALGYVLAITGHEGYGGIFYRLAMLGLLLSPLFFSGIIFSGLLKGSGNISEAMSYNLMGAMLGGALEYNSMQFGFAFLYLIAMGLYILAWIASRKAVAA